MNTKPSIVIADESALFLHLHTDGPEQYGATPAHANPLLLNPSQSPDLTSFNPKHPLYGGAPVSLLVGSDNAKKRSRVATFRACSPDLPADSFLKLREGLFVTSPELTYARMGNHLDEFQLAEAAMNLCARYYLDLDIASTKDRHAFLTSPNGLAHYLDKAQAYRGFGKARKALRWVVPNSGSPSETKMKLQYCTPLWAGGFGLPFTHMNYDVKAGRLASLTKQSDYCIDLVNPLTKEGMEYDGEDSHPDASKDKRRLNELKTLGYDIFPIDKAILYNPDAALKTGFLIRKHLGIRGSLPKNWENRYMMLRSSLNLPI